ncbi:MAG: hypothetical protein NTV14_07860 [Coprothermobacterota bacterium]|nr:hypothetical protein [Coprothermobacterota bacterium]
MANKTAVQPKKKAELSLPLALILIGLIFLVGNFFYLLALPWLWPAILLVIAVILLIRAITAKEGGAARFFFPIVLLLFGIVYLLTALNVFQVTNLMAWFWPGLLVVIGIAVLLRERR